MVFCSIRGAVTSRIPLAALSRQALTLREIYVQASLRRGVEVPVPVPSRGWLKGWRKEFGVSLRTPNRRWKISYSTCCERCRITWLNLYKVRRLCQLTFGYDPLIEGWDQKPFHFNESGSHRKKTLHWKGVVEVPLKECASAVRSRWSANTYTSTHPDRFDEFPPLEVLFKGGPVVLERVKTC